MLLENQEVQYEQAAQDRNTAKVPASVFGTGRIATLLPVSSYEGSRGSRIGIDQISRSNGSGEVGAFRQVASLISGGKDAAVAARSWCSPGRIAGLVSDQTQRPFGINATDRTQANSVGAQYVFDDNHFFICADFGKPEGNHGQVTKQQRGRKAEQRDSQSLSAQSQQPSQQQQAQAYTSEQARKSGSENLHVTTLTRLREVCLG
jgi:hypothetical protein